MRLSFRGVVCLGIVLMTTLPTIARDAGTPEPVVAQAFRSTNVRSGPGADYDIVGRMREGDEAPVIGRSDESSNWLLIDQGDQQGWVAFFTVTVSGNLNDVPIIPAGGPPPPSTTVEPAEQALQASTDVFVSAYRRVNVR